MSTTDGAGHEIEDLIDAFLADARPAWASGPVVAVAWATVDGERALGELTARWPALPPFGALPDDAVLGATVVGTVAPVAGDVRLALVEPNTEGRLAASLARRGEGPVAVWIAATTRPAQIQRSSVSEGPFGPERLVLGGAPGGPHVLLLERAAGTIEQ